MTSRTLNHSGKATTTKSYEKFKTKISKNQLTKKERRKQQTNKQTKKQTHKHTNTQTTEKKKKTKQTSD